MYTKSSVKPMQQSLVGCANSFLVQLLQWNPNRKRFVIDSREVFGNFLAESISASILNDRSKAKISEVFQVLKYIQRDLLTCNGSVKLLMFSLLPKIVRFQIFRQEVYDFFKKNLTQVIHERRLRTKTYTHDMIQLMIDATTEHVRLNDEAISAQFLIFFTGGFTSTLKLIESCFFELAKNQNIQSELISEVDAVVRSSREESTNCDAVNRMRFLDMFIHETLRKHPPVPYGTRVCTKDCVIMTSSGEQLKFIKGDSIYLPFKLLQNDPKYYVNPNLFDPSRFISEQSKRSLLAFGLGPRNCLGSQLVLLQSKVLIFTLLSKYSVKQCEKESAEENFQLELNLRE